MKKNKTKTKKINRIASALSLIGFIISTAVLLYPVISDRWNRYRDMQLIGNYNQTVKKGDKSEYEQILKTAQEYNEFLYSEGRNIVTDAEYEPDAYYETLLKVDNSNIMCYIDIPSIDVKEPVYHYSTEVSLGNGVGHIHGSSLPTGGLSTHSVLTGHRGMPNRKFFSDLDKIKLNDHFYIHVLGNTLAYEVIDINIIVPTDVEGLMIEEGRDLVTLVTCEPYGVNTHRLLVTGERVEFDEESVEDGFVKTDERAVIIDPAVWVFIGFMIFIAILVIIISVDKIKRKLKKSKENKSK